MGWLLYHMQERYVGYNFTDKKSMSQNQTNVCCTMLYYDLPWPEDDEHTSWQIQNHKKCQIIKCTYVLVSETQYFMQY